MPLSPGRAVGEVWDLYLILMGLLSRPVVGPRDHIYGHPASTLTPALGKRPGQEVIVVACECIQGAAWARPGAQHGRSRRSTVKLVPGLRDREPGGSHNDQAPQQVPACKSPGHL